MGSIRFFDIILCVLGLILLSPIFLLIVFSIKLSSGGSIFFKQQRVGKDDKDFMLFKFRTMYNGSDKKGLLTVGGRDKRITEIGYYLRKFKLDELPQLFNVIVGDMSIVGPRPEVRRYVNLYSNEQKKVLNYLPGITDYASIVFRNENELLASAVDPEDYYIKVLVPKKNKLNLRYIENKGLKEYFTIIAKTVVISLKGK